MSWCFSPNTAPNILSRKLLRPVVLVGLLIGAGMGLWSFYVLRSASSQRLLADAREKVALIECVAESIALPGSMDRFISANVAAGHVRRVYICRVADGVIEHASEHKWNGRTLAELARENPNIAALNAFRSDAMNDGILSPAESVFYYASVTLTESLYPREGQRGVRLIILGIDALPIVKADLRENGRDILAAGISLLVFTLTFFLVIRYHVLDPLAAIHRQLPILSASVGEIDPGAAQGDAIGELVVALNEETAARRAAMRSLLAAQQAQAEAQEHFVEQAPAALAMFDTEMRYLAVSRRWVVDFNLIGKPVVGQLHYELFPDLPPAWRATHQRALQGHLTTAQEDAFHRADGTTKWVNWEVRPWWRAPGQVGGVIIFSEDITARKQAELELKSRALALDAANKELEAFSYSASHDLRAPLRHINGYAELLAKAAASRLDPTAARYLRTIIEASDEMGHLIDGLLDFSRMTRTPLSRAKIDTAEVVRQVIAGFEFELRGRQVQWRLASLPPSYGDPKLLKQVWTNLISNAIKYSRHRDPAVIEIGSAVNAASELVFFISDNGDGFDMAHAQKLFGVFQRLHQPEQFEGVGVGLAIVQRILIRHGGRIWADATPGRGATFRFTIPASHRHD